MKKSKEMCGGCYCNDYNYGLGGSKECWNYKNATIEKKIQIHVDQRPPYNLKSAKQILSCYHKSRYVYVKPENLTSDGYWK